MRYSTPKEVTLGYMTYNVREYVPKPMRCYNCQRFGHTASTCKGKRRCASVERITIMSNAGKRLN